MPSYLDLGVIGVVLVSAILSLMRGFTREVLAIGSWVAAAAAAFYFHPYVEPFLDKYIKNHYVLLAVSAAIVFFATLIVVSLFTVRLSDAILDSKIGALDRSLGFVFGAARGFLLAVLAFAIFSWMLGDKQQPDWIANAKTKFMLSETAARIKAVLPEDIAQTVGNYFPAAAPGGADAPADQQKPAAVDPQPSPSSRPTPPPTPHASASPTRDPIGQIINDSVKLPPPVPAPTPGKP